MNPPRVSFSRLITIGELNVCDDCRRDFSIHPEEDGIHVPEHCEMRVRVAVKVSLAIVPQRIELCDPGCSRFN